MDSSLRFETMNIRERMNADGFIFVPLVHSLTRDKKRDENLSFALLKMVVPLFPNLVNSPDGDLYYCKWMIRESDGEHVDLHPFNEDRWFSLPTAFYPSVGDVLRYCLGAAETMHLPPSQTFNREECVVDLNDLLTVSDYGNFTTLGPKDQKLQRGRELFPDESTMVSLRWDCNKRLRDLLAQDVGNPHLQDNYLDVTNNYSVLAFDKWRSPLSERPFYHLMLEGLQERIINGRMRPCLYSFQMGKKYHEAIYEPISLPLKEISMMGSLSELTSLRLWVEDSQGYSVSRGLECLL
jgi:hypothetical protein